MKYFIFKLKMMMDILTSEEMVLIIKKGGKCIRHSVGLTDEEAYEFQQKEFE